MEFLSLRGVTKRSVTIMSHPAFPRRKVMLSLIKKRTDRVFVPGDLILPDHKPNAVNELAMVAIRETASRIIAARESGASCPLAFGAHTIKNGLAPVIMELVRRGFVTHLATNGAGIIHDLEMSVHGHTSEHVAENVACGCFGTWEETVTPLNMAICAGAIQGLGYGEAVGKALSEGVIDIPSVGVLRARAVEMSEDPAKAHLVGLHYILAAHLEMLGLKAGYHWENPVAHKDECGLQAFAFENGIPFTAHPMIGCDIIYQAPACCETLIGATGGVDFLRFAQSISKLRGGGVYLSLGSAVMSPMNFEKSLNMANNLGVQEGQGPITDHLMTIVDMQESQWDWTTGEPPEDNPDYYLRYLKSFSRMGGQMRYCGADNRDFLLLLLAELVKLSS